MKPKRKSDIATAVWVLLMAFLVGTALGVWVGRANACGSYEDCLEKVNDLVDSAPEKNSYEKHVVNLHQIQIYLNSAIAYKLDEISKKLDKGGFAAKENA